MMALFTAIALLCVAGGTETCSFVQDRLKLLRSQPISPLPKAVRRRYFAHPPFLVKMKQGKVGSSHSTESKFFAEIGQSCRTSDASGEMDQNLESASHFGYSFTIAFLLVRPRRDSLGDVP
jgi:hypothetical protein